MKTCTSSFLLSIALFMLNTSAYGSLIGCDSGSIPSGRKSSFQRTFQANMQKKANARFMVNHLGKKATANGRTSSNSVPVYISSEEFGSHLNVGNQRYFQEIDATDGGYSIGMDIGLIDYDGEAAQDWYLPDFSSFSPSWSLTANHIAVSEAFGNVDFPEATHALATQDGSTVEFFQLTSLDLYFLGYTENIGTPEVASYDYDQTLTPVPLDFDFGLQTTVVIEFEGDPDLDSVKYVQDYDVVGYGTLHTADDGSHEALKLIFTEKEYTYLNGAVDSTQYSEIVWYSKEGHHVRAGIDDPWNSEGQQDLFYIEYQKLTTVVPLAPTNLTASAQSASSILLNWEDKSVNESSFEIIRSKSAEETTDGTGTFQTIDATFTVPANVQQFLDNTAAAGTQYYYKVRAKRD